MIDNKSGWRWDASELIETITDKVEAFSGDVAHDVSKEMIENVKIACDGDWGCVEEDGSPHPDNVSLHVEFPEDFDPNYEFSSKGVGPGGCMDLVLALSAITGACVSGRMSEYLRRVADKLYDDHSEERDIEIGCAIQMKDSGDSKEKVRSGVNLSDEEIEKIWQRNR